jgi:nucleotide-binding universal stress UspA family protein
MLEIRLILCPIDFSEFSVWAYRHALSLAEHYQSKLVALHIVELWRYPSLSFCVYPNDYEECCQALHEHGKKQLQEFVRNNTDGETQPEIVVEQGNAADSILSFARARKVHLIVMGTHGRRGFERLVLGSVTDRMIRKAPCPVLALTKPPGDSLETGKEPSHEHRLRHILFCTDFSTNSEQAFNHAISTTAEYDAELTLLHVLEEVPSAAKTEQSKEAAAEQLERLIPPEARKTLKTKSVVRIGKPYQQIIQLVKEARIDMVVMGVRGRGALDSALFGSTTYRVIQLGSCPVLTI